MREIIENEVFKGNTFITWKNSLLIKMVLPQAAWLGAVCTEELKDEKNMVLVKYLETIFYNIWLNYEE